MAEVRDNEARPRQKQPIGRLFGALKHDGPPKSLEDMERAIAEGACEALQQSDQDPTSTS